jgi:hypothetical protein
MRSVYLCLFFVAVGCGSISATDIETAACFARCLESEPAATQPAAKGRLALDPAPDPLLDVLALQQQAVGVLQVYLLNFDSAPDEPRKDGLTWLEPDEPVEWLAWWRDLADSMPAQCPPGEALQILADHVRILELVEPWAGVKDWLVAELETRAEGLVGVPREYRKAVETVIQHLEIELAEDDLLTMAEVIEATGAGLEYLGFLVPSPASTYCVRQGSALKLISFNLGEEWGAGQGRPGVSGGGSGWSGPGSGS